MLRRAIIAIALLAGLAGAAGTPIPPAPTRWVTDQAALISETTRAQLDARLERYQQATGHQVIVWIGTTLGGAPIEDWCANAFRAWGIGRRLQDDGVALFLFATDRRDRIEVGYGLEDKLPDAYASRILRETLEPALKAQQADAGVAAAVDQILARLGDEPPGGAAITRAPPPPRGPGPFTIVLGVLAGLALLIFALTHPRLALWLLWSIMSGGRGGGGGFGGGGGGFGGGGGRSGGGGASGSW